MKQIYKSAETEITSRTRKFAVSVNRDIFDLSVEIFNKSSYISVYLNYKFAEQWMNNIVLLNGFQRYLLFIFLVCVNESLYIFKITSIFQ